MSRVYNEFLESLRVEENKAEEKEKKCEQERKIKGARGTVTIANNNEKYEIYYHKVTAPEFDIPDEREYVYNKRTGKYEEKYTDGRDSDITR